jgi:hypothetical protein
VLSVFDVTSMYDDGGMAEDEDAQMGVLRALAGASARADVV